MLSFTQQQQQQVEEYTDGSEEDFWDDLTWIISKEQSHAAGMTFYVCSDDAINLGALRLALEA